MIRILISRISRILSCFSGFGLARLFFRLENIRLNYRCLRFFSVVSGLKEFFHCLIVATNLHSILSEILPTLPSYVFNSTKRRFLFCSKMLFIGWLKLKICMFFFRFLLTTELTMLNEYRNRNRKLKPMVVNSSDFFDNPLRNI